MNELLTSILVLLVLMAGAVGMLGWMRAAARRQRKHRRDQAYCLIHELKEYSAWIESLHGEPVLVDAAELTSAESLRSARAIIAASFPVLSPTLLRLLQVDSHLMQHLWQQKLLRLSEPGEWQPLPRDASYRQLRDEQEDLVEEIIARCQVLIGDRGRVWRSTDIDSDFAHSFSMSTRPCR